MKSFLYLLLVICFVSCSKEWESFENTFQSKEELLQRMEQMIDSNNTRSWLLCEGTPRYVNIKDEKILNVSEPKHILSDAPTNYYKIIDGQLWATSYWGGYWLNNMPTYPIDTTFDLDKQALLLHKTENPDMIAIYKSELVIYIPFSKPTEWDGEIYTGALYRLKESTIPAEGVFHYLNGIEGLVDFERKMASEIPID